VISKKKPRRTSTLTKEEDVIMKAHFARTCNACRPQRSQKRRGEGRKEKTKKRGADRGFAQFRETGEKERAPLGGARETKLLSLGRMGRECNTGVICRCHLQPGDAYQHCSGIETSRKGSRKRGKTENG